MLSGLPGLEKVRSVSKFGLSQVVVTFKDGMDIYFARRLVMERLPQAREAIPAGFGSPEMGPISTGLGEIYMFAVEAKPGARNGGGEPVSSSATIAPDFAHTYQGKKPYTLARAASHEDIERIIGDYVAAARNARLICCSSRLGDLRAL